MNVNEEIKKSTASELTKMLLQWLVPLLLSLFLGLIPQVRDHIWPAIPKWLLLVLAIVFLSAALALLQFLLKARRKLVETHRALEETQLELNESQAAYENAIKPEEFEPDGKDKEILRYLFQSNIDRILSVIKDRLNFEHTEEVKLRLNTLIKHGYIRPLKRPRPGRFPEYWLTDKGREYVIKNLLESNSDS